MITVVACLITLSINLKEVEVIITGELIEEKSCYTWIVDLSHSASAMGLNSKDYSRVSIDSKLCVKKEIK